MPKNKLAIGYLTLNSIDFKSAFIPMAVREFEKKCKARGYESVEIFTTTAIGMQLYFNRDIINIIEKAHEHHKQSGDKAFLFVDNYKMFQAHLPESLLEISKPILQIAPLSNLGNKDGKTA